MKHQPLRRLRVPGVLLTGLAMVLTLQGPTLASSARKPAPRNFVVTATTPTTAHLDWRRVSGASGYRVHYATSSHMTHARSAAFRYSNGVLRGLKPGTRYWFQVAVAAKRGTGVAQSSYTPAPYLSRSTRPLPSHSPAPTPAPAPAPTPTPAPPVNGSYNLDVASNNISGINNDEPARFAPWAQRKDKVAEQLLGQSPADQVSGRPDVIALQEANTGTTYSGLTQYTDLVATLNRHATTSDHYAAITGITSLSTRIAYNDRTLSLVEAGAVKWSAQETQVDGLRYMAWAIFQVKSTGARFFFGSDHLETASESVRRQQWQQLIDDVPGLAGGLPVILGGDFNSPRGAESRCANLPNPTGNVMLSKMQAAGFGDTLGQLRCSTRPTVSGARAQHVVNGNFNSVNGFVPRLNHYSNGTIGQDVDYIFASNNLRVSDWAMVLDEAKTGSDEYTLQGVIPSDHNLIKAVITLPGS